MSAPTPPLDADEAARELADSLEARAVDYAIGGALALAQWGVIRGTFDVDLNLWVDPAQPTAAAELLGQLRMKDRADLEALLVVQGADFERDYVEQWVARTAGERDVRLSAWRAMVEAADAALRERDASAGGTE